MTKPAPKKAAAKPAAKPAAITKPALIEQHLAPKAKVDMWVVQFLAAIPRVAQLRTATDEATVERYAEQYRAQGTTSLPPVVVFYDGTPDDIGREKHHFVADGHHRIAAAARAKLQMMPVILKRGGRLDAILYAAKANTQHGLALTPADKHHTVAVFLAEPGWRKRSDRWIAEAAGVGPHLVAKVRGKLPEDQRSSVRESKDGKTRDTKGITKAKQKAKEQKPAPLSSFIDAAMVGRVAHAVAIYRPALSAEKVMVIAALAAAGDKGLNRDDLAVVCGFRADVHPGQLRRMHLVEIDGNGADALISLTDLGTELVRSAEDKSEQAAKASSGAKQQDLFGGEHPVDQEPEVLTAGEPEPEPLPSPENLDARRLRRTGELLAERLTKGKPQCKAKDQHLLALALVVGIPVGADDEPWSDKLATRAWSVLAQRTAAEVADRLERGETHKLPPLAQLASWWSIDIEALAIQAERAVPA